MDEIKTRYSSRVASMKKAAEKRPLEFRRDYRVKMALFTRDMRQMAKRFNSGKTPLISFFDSWQADLAPKLDKINLATNATKLQKALESDLLANSRSRDNIIKLLIPIRLYEEKKAFAKFHFSPNKESKLYKLAWRFINQPLDVCHAQIDIYVDYAIYSLVAKELGVVEVDRHASVIRRLYRSIKSRRQVRIIKRATISRLRNIEKQMAMVQEFRGGLVARIFALKIDFVEILTARKEYEKSLSRLSKKAVASASKRLALFEKKTDSLRSAYLDTAPGIDNLMDAQQAAKEINEVLLEVFDLDNTGRNEIMKCFKQYRELVRERKELELKLSLK